MSQLAVVLLLAPVFAGSVVEEKTRRTLPFLLVSRVTDWEIISSKLAVAWLRVLELIASGLPFAAICLLLGGITPEVAFADFSVCLAAAWASCGLAVLVSVLCRRFVDALLAVYLAQFLWYGLPLVSFVAGAMGYPLGEPDWIVRINAFRAIASGWSPISVLWWDFYGLSIAAMLLFGLCCGLGAWWFLRGCAERYEVAAPARGLFRRLLRARPRRCAVWDHAVLWRELRCRRTGGMELAVWLLYIVAAAILVSGIAWEWQGGALQNAMGPGPPALAVIAAVAIFAHLSLLALPYLAVAGATAFAEERAKRLIDFLRLTDLEPCEIVRAKAIRLMRTWAGMMLLPMLLVLCLVLVRWTAPIGCLLVAALCLSAGAFAVMLGLAIGLRARSTFQAILLTLVTGLIGGFFVPVAAMGTVAAIGADSTPGIVRHAVITMSVPVHCFLLAIGDSSLGPPWAVSLVEQRWVALGWTAAFVASSATLYRMSLNRLPALPASSRHWAT
jgi:ABC-type transport system involved in multi-copper enzyme maturation permease subunit